jgi:hypothetical protein
MCPVGFREGKGIRRYSRRDGEEENRERSETEKIVGKKDNHYVR